MPRRSGGRYSELPSCSRAVDRCRIVVDPLDILEVLLAFAAILGGVGVLFSPMIAVMWLQRREQPHASRRRGFPVLDAHPPAAPTSPPATAEPLHVLPLNEAEGRDAA